MYNSFFFLNKTHLCKQKNSKEKKREKNFLQCQVLEAQENFWHRRLEFGNNEKKRRFWVFSDERKVGLIETGNVWRCISISSGDAK